MNSYGEIELNDKSHNCRRETRWTTNCRRAGTTATSKQENAIKKILKENLNRKYEGSIDIPLVPTFELTSEKMSIFLLENQKLALLRKNLSLISSLKLVSSSF